MRRRDAMPTTEPEAAALRPSPAWASPALALPDARDGLTRVERVVLWQLWELERERDGRNVPTAQLYGRVVEHVDISQAELQRTLQRLIGVR